ncbi:MAG: NAD(P)H-dependent oxidoreductase [Spirochaetia bacterium]
MSKLMVITAHPIPSKSLFNKAWCDAAHQGGFTTHILADRLLPNGHFNIPEEDLLISGHQHIVFSFSLWWYSTPWILNKWFSEVLTPEFAYDKGRALEGKTLSCLVTYSGPVATHSKGQPTAHKVEEFLLAIPAIANYCGMKYIDPYIFYETQDTSEDMVTKSTQGALAHLQKIVAG